MSLEIKLDENMSNQCKKNLVFPYVLDGEPEREKQDSKRKIVFSKDSERSSSEHESFDHVVKT